MSIPLPPLGYDRTLEDADRALYEAQHDEPERTYFGLSMAGACQRRNYLAFYKGRSTPFDVITLKRFKDGHRTEDLVIERLKQTPDLTVLSLDPITGKQWEVTAVNGHAKGHLDGRILGIRRASKTLHVLEIKTVNEREFSKVKLARYKHGSKGAVKAYSEVHYAQVQVYMLLSGITRAFHIYCTPGGRDWLSCRTDLNVEAAEFYLDRAERIILHPLTIPDRISGNPDHFICAMCDFAQACHHGAPPAPDCRNCQHGMTWYDGDWYCDKKQDVLMNFTPCADYELKGTMRHE